MTPQIAPSTNSDSEVSSYVVSKPLEPLESMREILGAFQSELEQIAEINNFLIDAAERESTQRKESASKTLATLNNQEMEKLERRMKALQAFVENPSSPPEMFFEIDLEDGASATYLMNLVRAVMLKSRTERFVREMSVVFLVTRFEDLIQQVLLQVIKRKPQLLKTQSKSVTYEELLEFQTVNQITSMLGRREIEELLREDIDIMAKHLKKKFGIDFATVQGWPEFKELFYRRNIIVHNNATPNETYRTKSRYSGPNTRLQTDGDYVTKSIELVRRFSRALVADAHRKYFA